MRMKHISPTFLMSVMVVAAAVPMLFGVSVSSLVASATIVALSTFAVAPGVSLNRGMFGQLGEVGSVSVEEEYRAVQASLKSIGDDLKAYADKSEAELKRHGEMSTETRAQVDKLLKEQGELNARLQAAEQALASGPGPQFGGPAVPRSMGEAVVQSEGLEAAAANFARGGRGSFSVDVQAAVVTTQSDSSDGYPVEPDRVGTVMLPHRRMTIRQLFTQGRTSSNAIEYARQTGFTNNAAGVQENPSDPKPESAITYELVSTPIVTIAHWIPASKQALADVMQLQTDIDNELRYGLALREEAQLLNGSGSGVNINGVNTQATAFSNPGVSVESQTKIDTLRIAMLQVALAEYSADGIVLNPIDWAEIELLKDSQYRYLFANPQAMAGPTLWGLPVVATQSQAQEDFLVGAFQLGATIYDREDATVTISTEDRDNFVKNMVTILAEERLALAVKRPEAFVRGDFGSNN